MFNFAHTLAQHFQHGEHFVSLLLSLFSPVHKTYHVWNSVYITLLRLLLCSVLQCVAVCCSVLQCGNSVYITLLRLLLSIFNKASVSSCCLPCFQITRYVHIWESVWRRCMKTWGIVCNYTQDLLHMLTHKISFIRFLKCVQFFLSEKNRRIVCMKTWGIVCNFFRKWIKLCLRTVPIQHNYMHCVYTITCIQEMSSESCTVYEKDSARMKFKVSSSSCCSFF